MIADTHAAAEVLKVALRERLDMLSAPDRVAAAARQFRSAAMVLQAKTRQRQLGDHLGKRRASVNRMQHGARLLLTRLARDEEAAMARRRRNSATKIEGAYTSSRCGWRAAARNDDAGGVARRAPPSMAAMRPQRSPSATPASPPACAHGSTSPENSRSSRHEPGDDAVAAGARCRLRGVGSVGGGAGGGT